MTRHVGLVVWMLMTALLAGCSTPHEESWEVHGFSATITRPTGDVTFDFTFAEQVAVQDGSRMDLYQLTQHASDEVRQDTKVWYLDRDFQVVRHDNICHVEDWSCDQALETGWEYAGMFNPLGVGLPVLVAEGRPVVHDVKGQEAEVSVNVFDEEPLTLKMSSDGWWFHQTAKLRFAPGQLLGASPNEEVTRYEMRDALPAADDWTTPGLQLGAGDFEMFPGEEHAVFGMEASPLEVYNELLERSEDAQGVLDEGGCFWGFTASLQPPAERPLDWPAYRIMFLDADSSLRTFDIDEQFLDDVQGHRIEEKPSEHWGSSCDDPAASPRPAWGVQHFEQRIQDWPVDASAHVFLMVRADHLNWNNGLPPEAGRYIYRLTMEPAFVNGSDEQFLEYKPYRLDFDPHRDALAWSIVHPDDMASW